MVDSPLLIWPLITVFRLCPHMMFHPTIDTYAYKGLPFIWSIDFTVRLQYLHNIITDCHVCESQKLPVIHVTRFVLSMCYV